jgi:serine/threonine-protein kinase HipA
VATQLAGFVLDDFNACTKTALMKRGRAAAILAEVQEAVRRWPWFAAQAGVAEPWTEQIRQAHRFFPAGEDAGAG